jgi:copper(I)-binding protein
MIKNNTLPTINLFSFFIGLFFLLSIVPLPSYACDKHGMKIENAWARANVVTESGNSAIFVDIVNHSDSDDKLISAATDICKTVELHTHKKIGNVYQMRPIETISLPKGKKVSLKPGGLHIMLLNLKKPLNEGDTIQVTFTFEKAAEQTVDIEVRKAAAKKSHECPCNNH